MLKSILKPVVVAILQWEARRVLKKYKPRIVAVTGSVGKTSTKDVIYAVLAPTSFVRKSEKSFNSEIGVPLTILGCPNAWNNPLKWMRNFVEGAVLLLFPHPYPRWLVLEVGADRPGDIQKIAGWLHPDVVVVTRLPDVPVHVEFFDSPQGVVNEKSYLPRALKPGGTLVLNADDENALRFSSVADSPTVVTYGFNHGAAVQASNERVVYRGKRPAGAAFYVNHAGSSIPFTIEGALGRQHIYATLAGVAVGVAQGLNLVDVADALAEHTAPPGRMRLTDGVNGSTIVDDSYNSSPVAAEEAIKVLASLKASGKKVAVLGDMLELGYYSVREHQRVGEFVAGAVSLLITVGPRARGMAEAARKSGLRKRQILVFDEAREAGKALVPLLKAGDIVLVKGSQSIRLERVVEQIMNEPARREVLLVRQDDAWRRR